MEFKGIIYKITNNLNGKCYIGQTTNSAEYRWYQHCKKSSKSKVSVAMQKYGKDNFTFEIVDETAVDRWDLYNLEMFYIKKYNSIQPTGYNLTSGGDNGHNVWEFMSEEDTKQYKNNISKNLKKYFSNKENIDRMCIAKGSFYFEAYCRKTMKLAWSGCNRTECSRVLNIPQANMYLYLKSKLNNKSYIFKVNGEFLYYEDTRDFNTNGFRVLYKKNNKTYKSVKEASIDLNMSYSALIVGIKKKSEKYKDFIIL